MDAIVSEGELLDRSGLREDQPVVWAGHRSLAVDGLRGGDYDLTNRQVLIADDLEHLGGAEAVDVYVLAHLRHVAAVCRLVENYVNVLQRRAYSSSVTDVGVYE